MNTANSRFRKPFKLLNRIQHYDWGTKNEDAFIPRFTGIPAVPDRPYAELWIGAHPGASSEIIVDGEVTPLNKVIDEAPVEILGEEVARRFGNRLPFLLKILSAGRALSIQAHPDRVQARRLHAADPAHYPDDNHKPEIAIALDSLTAIAGFRPLEEIADAVRRYPELQEIAGTDIVRRVLAGDGEPATGAAVKELYAAIMRRAGDAAVLSSVIGRIIDRLPAAAARSEEERIFVEQHAVYGADVGLLSIFFFNLVHLKPRQAIFTEAGVPHAYIRGNIVECMANSDNVVRAGLTGKFKDVPSLLDILQYRFAPYPILNREAKTDGVVYRTAAEEFEIRGYRKSAGFDERLSAGGKPVVVLVTLGALDVRWDEGGSGTTKAFRKGDAFLVPAALPAWRMSAGDEVEFYTVSVP